MKFTTIRVLVCGATSLFFSFLFLFFLVLWDRVFMCSLDCPGARSLEQTDLELSGPPTSAGIEGARHHRPALFLFLSVFVHRPKENCE